MSSELSASDNWTTRGCHPLREPRRRINFSPNWRWKVLNRCCKILVWGKCSGVRYAKGITKISLFCGILSSLIWQDTIERAVGHYTISRDHDVTDQECRLSFPSFPDHLSRPRQDGGRKWAGDETKYWRPWVHWRNTRKTGSMAWLLRESKVSYV